ncbi:protein-disulfide reductase DsbD domain-containing protein [Eilatimonas milleporae]|uniref:DsbC/DsbD-like thiol-disulfide interchange protein n=1 Tax=Eilatimonas milleporae TaxID=911205 RepID=A0A3M0CN25_9PROT|nr:protein-disulfide reductase DsbD domain-containing protein [Eilatimonas milleporae]RMB04653.1 DsbC/DsbD-like thiol-disulfide interchange protein [Eilatimonas milleporae]
MRIRQAFRQKPGGRIARGMLPPLMAVFAVLWLAPLARGVETPWQNHQDMVETRLVGAPVGEGVGEGGGEDGRWVYGWEARLSPGWKTYWRSPGEAGLPVVISREGEPVEVFYTLPERFELFGLETYGYSKRVLLPFAPGNDVGGAEISVSFMVCKDICVPFDARYEIPRATGQGGTPVTHGILLEQALARVPDRTGDGGAGLTVISAAVTGPPGRQRLVVDAAAGAPLVFADLMAEAGEGVHFGRPDTRLLDDGRRIRFVVPAMVMDKSSDLRGRQARLTFTDGRGHAIDRLVRLND